jgi:serine/threonine-protein kinase
MYGEIAAGGMATVHYGRLFGTAGFSRTVAIKRLHPQFAKDPEFVAMFLDEAHVAACVLHPNVVPTLDVVATDGELFLVMEYVQGETLGRLLATQRATGGPAPLGVTAAIVSGVLHGLHAAHEATSAQGTPLGVVHRDVSPQNVLIGADGVARVLDFGIAKARDRIHITRGGSVKGKVAYMAPEQLVGAAVDRRTDVYAAGAVLWEALVGRRCFQAEGDLATAEKVKTGAVEPPGAHVAGLPTDLDALVLRALSTDPADRFPTAREMALALEACAGVAPQSRVGAWVEGLSAQALGVRARELACIEERSRRIDRPARDAVEDPDPEGAAPTVALEHVLSSAPEQRPAGAVRAAGRRWLGAVAVAVAAAVAIAIVAVRGVRAQAERTGLASSSGTTGAPQVASAAAVEPEATSPVAPTAPSGESAPATPVPAAPASAPAAKRDPCKPFPFTVDARGIRHLKPECLRR